MASYSDQVRKAQQVAEIQQAAAAFQAMITVHQHQFQAAEPPVAPPGSPVDKASIETRCLADALTGVPLWRRSDRRDARKLAAEQAAAQIQAQQEQAEREHAEAQEGLDAEWQRLLANDHEIVLHTLEAAFADNEAPAVPVDCDGDRVTILMLMEDESAVPERVPTLTPTGKASWRKLSQTDRGGLYRAWVYSNILATVREAFAVAPGLQAATVAVLRRGAETPYGEHPLSVIYVGTLRRSMCDRIAWTSPTAVDAVLDADDLQIRVAGRSKLLSPLDLSQTPELAAFVSQVASGLDPDTGAVD